MAVADAHTVSSVVSEAIPKHGAERATILRDALAAARAISDNENRARALGKLAPLLPGVEDEPESIRARALGELAPLLPQVERESVLHDALIAAHAISDDFQRARALGELAPHLPEAERGNVLYEALTAARAISRVYNDYNRVRALRELAARLPEVEREDVLHDALVAARAISQNTSRAHALGELAPRLPEAEREDVLHDALTAARAISDDYERALVLGELARHFPETSLPEKRALHPSRATPRPQFFLTRITGSEDQPDGEILTLPPSSSPTSPGGDVEQMEQDVFFSEEFRTVAGSNAAFGPDVCLTALHQVIFNAGAREELFWKPEYYEAYAKEIYSFQIVPIMNSPVSGSTLLQMVTAAGGGAAFMAAFPNADAGHIVIYFLLIGGTRIVLGAADGVSIALREGLSHILLKWMGAPTTSISTRKRKKASSRNSDTRKDA